MPTLASLQWPLDAAVKQGFRPNLSRLPNLAGMISSRHQSAPNAERWALAVGGVPQDVGIAANSG
jgi:hypothetical protein